MPALASATPWELAALAWLALLGIPLAVIDVRSRRLPNSLTAPAFAGVIVLAAAAAIASHAPGQFLRALAGAAALAGFYLLLLVIRPAGMGLGDVKLAASVGAALGWLSWQAVIIATFAGFLLAAIAGLALVATRRGTRATQLPFGPFMLAGVVITLLLAGL